MRDVKGALKGEMRGRIGEGREVESERWGRGRGRKREAWARSKLEMFYNRLIYLGMFVISQS